MNQNLSVPRSRRRRRRVMKDRTTVYHVMSRMVRKQFWFGERERDVFIRMMRKQAAFTGLEVLTYCMMGNHFHLLLRVPECPLKKPGEHLLPDDEILRRYEAFYGKSRPVSTYSVIELKAALATGGAVAEKARSTVLARMGDLSAFMKELKQRFGIWFNHEHDNHGTIWEERFKSILVENEPEVLTQVAAYIDLNPVRAGVVSDPEDYRWSGYANARGGSLFASKGIIGLYPFTRFTEGQCLAQYRRLLFEILGIEASNGPAVALTKKSDQVSPFSGSIVLGSADFVKLCITTLAQGPIKLRCWSGWQVLTQFRSD